MFEYLNVDRSDLRNIRISFSFFHKMNTSRVFVELSESPGRS